MIVSKKPGSKSFTKSVKSGALINKTVATLSESCRRSASKEKIPFSTLAFNFQQLSLQFNGLHKFHCYLFIIRRFKCVRLPYIFLLLIPFSFFTTFYLAYRVQPYYYPEMTSALKLLEARMQENLIKEKGRVCKMPKLKPFAPEMMKFVREVDKIVCNEVEWVECFLSECKIKEDILAKMKKIECIYKDIIYVDDDNYYLGPGVKVLDDQSYNLNRSDYVKVSCKGIDKMGSGAITNRWGGNKAGFRPVEVPPTNSEEKPLNILLVLFDSTSRNNFIRLMPHSLKYLTDELNAVIMNGYNVVGDGTSQALLPMMTGHHYMELPDARRSTNNTRKFDLEHFIFDLLKNKGYRTAYFEDSSHNTFSYSYNGFNKQPTDHYLLPLFQDETKWWSYIVKKYNCIGSLPVHAFLFNLTRQFFHLPGKKFCITFSSTLSHDDFSMLNAADDDLVEFLKGFQSWGRNDTLLFVMADHGSRFSAIRNIYQGNLEERMPFVSVIIPESFKQKRPLVEKYLKANSEVLTTPYDMHATMLDFLGLYEYRNRKKTPGSELERGLSFFKPIPKSRTCPEAFILPHHCACTVWHNVSVSDPMYKRTGRVLAGYIDSLTAERRSLCAPRRLIAIEWVLRMGYEADNSVPKDDTSNVYYQAKIQMSPGIAMYEGSMRYVVKYDYFTLTSAEISRTNAYGDEPACIRDTEPSLRMFCFCKDRLPKNDVNDTNVKDS